jgi:hypothetical protein
VIGYALTCDGCLRHFNECLWSGKDSMARTAREEGWHVADNGAALCPDCDRGTT